MPKIAAAIKSLPPVELLREMFDCNLETGTLVRKALSVSHFARTTDPRGAAWVANNYNSQNDGREAFTSRDSRGALHGKILGTKYQAHRVIWKWVHGEDPLIIDHINGNPADNRLANLRSGTIADNSRNYTKPAGKSSKYRGVRWVSRDKSWTANISAGELGKIALGYFKSEIEAAQAYDRAARQYHGDFATLNFPNGGH